MAQGIALADILDVLGLGGGGLGKGLAGGLSGIDISQAATAFIREDEITEVGDQLSKRFGFNVSDIGFNATEIMDGAS